MYIDERKFPFWGKFLDDIGAKNAFVVDRRIRRFQHEVLSSGRLAIVSPSSGQPIEAIWSHHLRGDRVCYEFSDGIKFFLIASAVGHGYPLTHAAIDGFTFDFSTGSALAQDDNFLALEDKGLPSPGQFRNLVGPLLLIGHINFAHHLWNELSALDGWLCLNREAPSRLTINCQFEPLGKIEKLFPELAQSYIYRGSYSVNSRPAGSLITRLGSTLISHQVQHRVVDGLKRISQEFDTNIFSLSQSDERIFWITIRAPQHGRACINQSDFLYRLILQIDQKYPGSKYIFDGFSLPIDYNKSEKFSAHSSHFDDRIQATKDIASDIVRTVVAKSSLKDHQFFDASGLNLAEAIILAGKADYYISHAGSIQHKIGWLYSVPGCIHSCQAGITPAAQRWISGQVENGILPHMIPASCVEDEVSPAGIATRNVSYAISDIDHAIEDIIFDIQLRALQSHHR